MRRRRKISRSKRTDVSDNSPESVLGNTSKPDNEEFFLFDRGVRSSITPTLTPLFAITWYWPKRSQNGAGWGPDDNTHRDWDVGPTTITELRSVPRVRKGDRLLALTITEGRRLLLPLVPEKRESSEISKSGVYWRVPVKPYEEEGLPQFPRAQLVVGKLNQIEEMNVAMRRISSLANNGDGNASFVACYPDNGPSETFHCSLGIFSFKSIPFRSLWLHRVPNCIVVSLPCEEKMVFINAHAETRCTTIAPHLSANVLPLISSFDFPPYIVPLDLNEVFDRPFIVVGTLLHGVIVVRVEDDGKCVGVVHHIPLMGLGSAVFPVTRLVAVFPPSASSTCGTLEMYGSEAALVSKCVDGAIVCSSPYENRTVVVKCASATNDGCGYELAPPRGELCSISASTSTYPSVGTLVGTHDGKIISICAGTEIEGEGVSGSNRHENMNKCRSSGSYDAVYPTVLHTNLITLVARPPVNIFCEGGPVLQRTSYNKYKLRFTRHWLCYSTFGNEVVLLNRTIQTYTVHSVVSVKLPMAETPTVEVQHCTVGNTTQHPNEGCSCTNEGETSIAPRTRATRCCEHLEDCIFGLSWLLVDDGLLQVVVAHHRNWLSTITWRV